MTDCFGIYTDNTIKKEPPRQTSPTSQANGRSVGEEVCSLL